MYRKVSLTSSNSPICPFVENRPTPETAQTLTDELLFQRATQTYLWALPLINTLGMKVGSEKQFGAGYNVLPIWKKRLDAKTLVTTPNSDVIYAMSYVDLGKDGPIVFEAPPQMQGILLDFWHTPSPSTAASTSAMSVSSVPIRAKAASSSSFRPDTRGLSLRALRLSLQHQQRLCLPSRLLRGPQEPRTPCQSPPAGKDLPVEQ